MANRLLLVRHARVAPAYVGRLVGSTDAPLDSAVGPQLRFLADRVQRRSPQVIYCSPLKRCRQTAAAVAAKLPMRVAAELREIDFGTWENHTFSEVAAAEPALVDRWAAFDPDFAFPGGESVGGFLDRIRTAIDRLVQVEASTVLVVTHGGVIRAMLCQLLGLEPRKYVAFEVPYAAMAVVDLYDGQGVLAALERPDFAEGDHG